MPIVAEMTVAIHSVVRTFSATMFVSFGKKTHSTTLSTQCVLHIYREAQSVLLPMTQALDQ